MSKLRLKISMSLDGFVAGPDQSVNNPLGIGGMRLHEWAFPLRVWRSMQGLEGGEVNESTAVVEESIANLGATVMGRTRGVRRQAAPTPAGNGPLVPQRADPGGSTLRLSLPPERAGRGAAELRRHRCPRARLGVISLSGAHWYHPGWRSEPATPWTETGWLTRRIASEPGKPLRVFLAAGNMESACPFPYLAENRRLADVLTALRYPVRYVELNGGHSVENWLLMMPAALEFVLGRPAKERGSEGGRPSISSSPLSNGCNAPSYTAIK